MVINWPSGREPDSTAVAVNNSLQPDQADQKVDVQLPDNSAPQDGSALVLANASGHRVLFEAVNGNLLEEQSDAICSAVNENVSMSG